jgi:TonB family protein
MASVPKRLLIALVIAFGSAHAQEQDALLTATHDELRETVREALAADPETLKQWSGQIAKNEAVKKEFCPDYEQRHLAGFYSALADSKNEKGEKAREARAQATWKVYLLASMRPATKEDLKQLLLKAKEGAPAGSGDDKAAVWDFATQERIEKSLAALERPVPGRIRISQQNSQCYLVSKVQPRYPMMQLSSRTQGDAVLKAVVGRDGKVIEITSLSGDPGLLRAATDAVKKWRYRPYLLSGQPVEFETQVTVKFSIPGSPIR